MQYGILADCNNEPLESRIRELKRQIRESEDYNTKEELDQLYRKAKYLINLSGKKFFFSWNLTGHARENDAIYSVFT